MKKLERRLSGFAIHDLTLYLVGAQGLTLLLGMARPEFLSAILLIPAEVLAGQWWRLLSFVFTPPGGNPIFAIFALYFLFFMGRSLEAQWGALRYNLYVLIGYGLTIVAAFVFPYSVATNTFITGSIFLAFAYLFPDFTLMLFFVLPVRVKWLALLTWLYYAYRVVFGDWDARLLVLASITNFLLFFGKDIFYLARHGHRRTKAQVRAIAERNKPRHVCTVCGITDLSHREMDFRYCTKCEPPVAYCAEHLRNHPHLGQPPGTPLH